MKYVQFYITVFFVTTNGLFAQQSYTQQYFDSNPANINGINSWSDNDKNRDSQQEEFFRDQVENGVESSGVEGVPSLRYQYINAENFVETLESYSHRCQIMIDDINALIDTKPEDTRWVNSDVLRLISWISTSEVSTFLTYEEIESWEKIVKTSLSARLHIKGNFLGNLFILKRFSKRDPKVGIADIESLKSEIDELKNDFFVRSQNLSSCNCTRN